MPNRDKFNRSKYFMRGDAVIRSRRDVEFEIGKLHEDDTLEVFEEYERFELPCQSSLKKLIKERNNAKLRS